VSFYGGGITGLLDRIPFFKAPMMMFWGGLDKHIKPEDTRKIADELKAAGKEYAMIEFSHANHGYFCDARPSYNKDAAQLSWGLVLDFYKSHLS